MLHRHLQPALWLAALVASQPTLNYTRTYGDGTVLRVELISYDSGIVRVVTIPPGASEAFLRHPLTVPQPAPTSGFTVSNESSGVIWLSTPRLAVAVNATAAQASLFSAVDGALLSGEVGQLTREPESQCGNGHGGPIKGGCLRSWRSLSPGEGIYGFGTQFYGVDHVNTTKWIQTDAVPSAAGFAHCPAPFFISSLGYGVAINTHRYSYFDVGFALPPKGTTPGVHLMHSADPVFDVFLFAGPTTRDVVAQYTQLFGRTAMPPQWALGLWYHPLESSNQTRVEAVVAEFSHAGIPLAAVTLEPPWQTHAYSCTYVWNPSTFWDPLGFIARMSANGTAVTLWQHAYVYNASQGLASPLWGPIYGGGLAADFITWGGATPDWSLPATRTAVTSYMSSQFLTAGIEAFKLDECDGGPDQPWFFPDSAQFPSGFNGAAMHNIFGLLYAETYHEMFAAAGKRTFLKARAGYMGGQRYPTTMYSDSYDYDAYINALVNTGFGGFTWAPELRSADSDSEFVRRAQVMLFSGLSSMDGWNTGFEPVPPFVPPGAAALFKVFYDARMELIPALYAAYSAQNAQGWPAVRSLVLDFGSGADAAPILGRITDQYMLASLLVAPVGIGRTSRSIYFPAASSGWVDYFNPGSRVYNASSAAVIDAPDEVLPVFQQLGSVIPLAHATRPDLLRLRAVVPRVATVHESDGSGLGQRAESEPQRALIYSDDGRTTRYSTMGEAYRAHASITAAHTDAGNGGSGNGADLRISLAVTEETRAWTPPWSSVLWEVVVPSELRQHLLHVGGATAGNDEVLLCSVVCDGVAANGLAAHDFDILVAGPNTTVQQQQQVPSFALRTRAGIALLWLPKLAAGACEIVLAADALPQ